MRSERGQEVQENYINAFSEEILIGGKSPFWTPKWYVGITLDLLYYIFFKFSARKQAKSYIKIALMFFLKKILFREIVHFVPKRCILIILDLLQGFLKIFWTMNGANRYMKIILMVFSEKILVWPKWGMLGLKMKRPHNSG